MRPGSVRELGVGKMGMTQAGKLIEHFTDPATLQVAARAVESREILSLLWPRWGRMLPIRPRQYETGPFMPSSSGASVALLPSLHFLLGRGLCVS
jgi:hypothetical protein